MASPVNAVTASAARFKPVRANEWMNLPARALLRRPCCLGALPDADLPRVVLRRRLKRFAKRPHHAGGRPRIMTRADAAKLCAALRAH